MLKLFFQRLSYIFICLISFIAHAFTEVDFDGSMGVWHDERYKFYNYRNLPDVQKHLDMFKEVYNLNKPSARTISSENIEGIPKIIHQIWVGPRPFPDLYRQYAQKWQDLHPNWEYRLWTDEDVANWNFSTKDLYEKAHSYQEKADILRYEILLKFGGLYIDTDFEVIKNFDFLHENYEFYGSVHPATVFLEKLYITNAIIGARPGHQILKNTIKHLRNRFEIVKKDLMKKRKRFSSPIEIAIYRSMYPLTLGAYEYYSNGNYNNKSIILPPTYFLPKFPGLISEDRHLSYKIYQDLNLGQKIIFYINKKYIKLKYFTYELFHGKKIEYDISFNKIMPESMATHDFEEESTVDITFDDDLYKKNQWLRRILKMKPLSFLFDE